MRSSLIPCLTVKDVAAALRYSRQTVYNLIEAGVLPAGRPPGGHSLRIRPEDFEAFVQRMFAPTAQDRDATVSSGLPEQLRLERGSHSAARNANVAAERLPDGTPDVVALARRISAASR